MIYKIYSERGLLPSLFCPIEFLLNKIIRLFGEKIQLFLGGIDVFQRYCAVSKELSAYDSTVLDAGGGNSKLHLFFKGQICVLDNSWESMRKLNNSNKIRADACDIPFPNNSFKYVVSVACLEHIPQDKRKMHINELKRVCSEKTVIYAPIGKTALKYDKILLTVRRMMFIKDKWTAEHIRLGHPAKVLLLQNDFQEIKKIQNADVWLICMILQSLPILGRILPGWIYLSFLQYFNRQPPFIGSIFVFNKHEKQKIIRKNHE